MPRPADGAESPAPSALPIGMPPVKPAGVKPTCPKPTSKPPAPPVAAPSPPSPPAPPAAAPPAPLRPLDKLAREAQARFEAAVAEKTDRRGASASVLERQAALIALVRAGAREIAPFAAGDGDEPLLETPQCVPPRSPFPSYPRDQPEERKLSGESMRVGKTLFATTFEARLESLGTMGA